jgi:hypothetical protein
MRDATNMAFGGAGVGCTLLQANIPTGKLLLISHHWKLSAVLHDPPTQAEFPSGFDLNFYPAGSCFRYGR